MDAGRTVRQPTPRGAQPQRTCVGCRARADRSQLLRVVAGVAGGPPTVVPDVAARLPGRGAWLHPDLACLALAERRRAFPRALRLQGAVDAGAVRTLLEQRAPLDGAEQTPPPTGSGTSPHGHAMSSQR